MFGDAHADSTHDDAALTGDRLVLAERETPISDAIREPAPECRDAAEGSADQTPAILRYRKVDAVLMNMLPL